VDPDSELLFGVHVLEASLNRRSRSELIAGAANISNVTLCSVGKRSLLLRQQVIISIGSFTTLRLSLALSIIMPSRRGTFGVE
jgi:hypothetical protein